MDIIGVLVVWVVATLVMGVLTVWLGNIREKNHGSETDTESGEK